MPSARAVLHYLHYSAVYLRDHKAIQAAGPLGCDMRSHVEVAYILTSNAHKLTMALLTTKRSFFQVIAACLFLKLNGHV